MEQLVILVIIGLISLVNWLLQRSAELREKRKQERKRLGIPEGSPYHPAPEPAPSPLDPAEHMRRLMEALGLPVESDEPPPRMFAEEPPPLPLPPAAAAPKPPARPQRPSPPVPAAAAGPAASLLGQTLKQRGSLRQAIVLREILGPPKGLVS